MFIKEKFVKNLDRFEVDCPYDLTSEEIHTIVEYCNHDEDPLYLGVYMGFLCGCMKAGEDRD